MKLVLRELNEALATGRPCVLCTLVETRGSTPQKAGANMLVYADGSQAGTLGGGCVEAEVKRRALGLLDRGEADLMVFQLDHDYGWDDGLICGGKMTILANPFPAAHDEARQFFLAYEEEVVSGRGCTETIITEACQSAPMAARFLFSARAEVLATLRAAAAPKEVLTGLPRLMDRPRPGLSKGIAYLPTWPRIRLVIIGGGHVGQAVADLAAQADFDVWVLDDREAYANQQRFPRARRICVGGITPTLLALKEEGAFTSSTFTIIVTRGHAHDEEALHHLATTESGYLGMIGSQRKIRLIFEDLLAKGVQASALDRVHAPLGVNIGSQTVPEIAISIVAELIACRNLGSVPPSFRERRHSSRGESCDASR